MKRRNAICLIPLSMAGLASIVSRVFAQDAGSIGEKGKSGFIPGAHGTEPLSIRYLNKVRDMLLFIRETQSDKLLEASYAIARTVMKKNTCWYSWDMGHSLTADLFPGRNGVPEIFTVGYDPKKSKNGDLFLANVFAGPHDDLEKKDIFVIGSPVPWSMDAKGAELIVSDSAKVRIRPYSKIWIETNLTTVGAIMQVPGMPAPIAPVSGIIGMVTFWMMMADTCRILALEGQSVPVRGDEPKLSGKNVSVSLSAPLMDDYFDSVMQQMEMIGMELGNIRQIARMAVDTVLSGGKVYCYSRYRDSLSIESQTRRGGLGLTCGIDEQDGKIVTFFGDFQGTSKDMVIMGISQPEDDHDLKNLDFFRKTGMKIASIGPITRDTKIPSGRTVPKETDVHAGRMCDTYGLFAIPGFERKICPTSGALLNQIYWATCMEIMEEMIRRTDGNVPGVFYSAAIKDGARHMLWVNEVYKERGY